MALGRSSNINKPVSVPLAGESETQEIVLPIQAEGEHSQQLTAADAPISPSMPSLAPSNPLEAPKPAERTGLEILIGTEIVALDRYQFFRLKDRIGRTTNFDRDAADHVKLALRAYLGI